jgi:carboxymethylenebutenolidase
MGSDNPSSRDFSPEVLRLFDAYVHNDIDRRAFLEQAAGFAGEGRAAEDLLESLRPRFSQAQQVPPDDPRFRTEHVEFPSPAGYGRALGYLVSPLRSASEHLPAVLVLHENRGLNPHIEDVARRLALAGFIALAPDALFPLGGYPGDEDQARGLFAKLDQSKSREDLAAAASYLQARPESNGRLGVVGFCYGGGIASYLATRLPDLRAAVSFYGSAPPLEKVGAIQAPLLLHFAAHDERINAGWPAYAATLGAAEVAFQVFHYRETRHGFHNDTTPRYDPPAAKLAWRRTVAFFEQTLRHDA